MTTITSKSVYFTHDSNALSDEKIIRLRKRQGIEGYGIYFALLEKLSASNEYKINMSYVEDLAYDWHLDPQKVLDVIRNYNLFEIEGDYFYSKSHRLKMQYKDEKADKKRAAILARMAGMTPEELSKQNTKAAKAKWDKYYADKAKEDNYAQSSCTDCTENSASSALNKDKDKDINKDKNIDRDKEKNKDKEKGLDVVCVTSASAASEQPTHTTHPTVVNNKIMSKENIGLDYSKLTLPKVFEDEIEKYKTSKFFKNMFKIRFAYERYGKLNPSKFITISKFEKLIFLGMFKYYECKTNDDVNTQCLYDERIYYPVDKIEDIVTYSKENKDEVTDILNKHQIRVDDYTPKVKTEDNNANVEDEDNNANVDVKNNTSKVKIENGVYKYTPKKGMTIIEPNPDDYDLPF